MNKESAVRSTTRITYIAMMVALLAIMAQISIPLGFGVPLTLQMFGIMLIYLLFRTRTAFTIVLVYLVLGAIGLPVFANFSGGWGSFVGKSGGYLIGYLVGSLIIPTLQERFSNSVQIGRINLTNFIWLIVGIAIIHFLGMFQFAWITGMTLMKSFFILSVFIPVDIVKAFGVLLITPVLLRNLPLLKQI